MTAGMPDEPSSEVLHPPRGLGAPSRPVGPPVLGLRASAPLAADGAVWWAVHVPGDLDGPPGVLQGGLVAALHLALAREVDPFGAPLHQLEVRLEAPTPLGATVLARARPLDTGVHEVELHAGGRRLTRGEVDLTGADPLAAADLVALAEAASERVHPVAPDTAGELGRVVAKAATQIATDVDAVAILVFSLSGRSVQLVSKYRPRQRIVGLTPDERALRRFALMWGADGAIVPTEDRSLDLMRAADEVCLQNGIGGPGDRVVIVAGVPGGRGGTNRVIVHELGDETNLSRGR